MEHEITHIQANYINTKFDICKPTSSELNSDFFLTWYCLETVPFKDEQLRGNSVGI